MRDYSLPPFSLAEIGRAVKQLGETLNVPCNLAHSPEFKKMGYFSLPELSEDMVRIGSRFGFAMTPTNSVEKSGHQLQSLILFLRSNGLI